MSMEHRNDREHDYSLHYDTADIQVNEMKSKITKISCQENHCVFKFNLPCVLYDILHA